MTVKGNDGAGELQEPGRGSGGPKRSIQSRVTSSKMRRASASDLGALPFQAFPRRTTLFPATAGAPSPMGEGRGLREKGEVEEALDFHAPTYILQI